MRWVAAATLLVPASLAVGAQPWQPLFPVGVVVGPEIAAGPRADLLELARLRFNVVAVRDAGTRELRLEVLSRLLGQTPGGAAVPISASGVDVVSVRANTTGATVRAEAWLALARGARGVVFDSAQTLLENPGALQAAAAIADNLTRNAALFAALRPRRQEGDVRVDAGSSVVEARFLESRAALVFIAVNLTATTQPVTMTFSRDMPEAIWQNMETGGAVNFVAGAEGPTYTRTFTPADVVVLMIGKRYK